MRVNHARSARGLHRRHIVVLEVSREAFVPSPMSRHSDRSLATHLVTEEKHVNVGTFKGLVSVAVRNH